MKTRPSFCPKIKKNPATSGPDVEWTAINGKEFYQLITSSIGKGRYFIDMDEFMIESTEAEYMDWCKERDHSDYLHEQESQVQLLSNCFHRGIFPQIHPVIKSILGDFHRIDLVGFDLADRSAAALLDEQRLQHGHSDTVLM